MAKKRRRNVKTRYHDGYFQHARNSANVGRIKADISGDCGGRLCDGCRRVGSRKSRFRHLNSSFDALSKFQLLTCDIGPSSCHLNITNEKHEKKKSKGSNEMQLVFFFNWARGTRLVSHFRTSLLIAFPLPMFFPFICGQMNWLPNLQECWKLNNRIISLSDKGQGNGQTKWVWNVIDFYWITKKKKRKKRKEILLQLLHQIWWKRPRKEIKDRRVTMETEPVFIDWVSYPLPSSAISLYSTRKRTEWIKCRETPTVVQHKSSSDHWVHRLGFR